jgi:hypothetical protein
VFVYVFASVNRAIADVQAHEALIKPLFDVANFVLEFPDDSRGIPTIINEAILY